MWGWCVGVCSCVYVCVEWDGGGAEGWRGEGVVYI